MKEYERKQLLERIDREGATVGSRIPERITVQGEEIDLREFVFAIKRLESIPPGEREQVEETKKNLRRERLQRRQLIEAGTIDYEEGKAHAEAIIGIDRALTALDRLGPTDLEAESEARATQDQKRWIRFLRRALGREQDTVSRGRGRR